MKERARLKRILRLKERVRDAERGALARADAGLERASAEVDEAVSEVRRLGDSYVADEALEARELAHRAELIAFAIREREAAVERRHAAERERVAQAAAVGAAARAVRSLEALDARLAKTERRGAERREQTQADEHAARLRGAR